MSTFRPRGVYTALITPMHADGTVDFDMLDALVDQQLAAGVHGLVPCGTTGEAVTLTTDEQLAVVKRVLERTAGKVPVIAGASASSTAQAVHNQRAMAELGVAATLHATPAYNKPTQEGLFLHYDAIAKASDTPIVLYNVPGRSAVDLLPETVARLVAAHAHIVAIKEATGDVARAQDILTAVHPHRPDFAVLSGEDAFVLPLLAMGGTGVISVTSHVMPETMVRMVDAVWAGDMETARACARAISPVVPWMFKQTNPIPVKTAWHVQHGGDVVFRLPLCPMTGDQAAALRAALAENGLLGQAAASEG